MKSMTGYGRARQVLHGRTVTVELRAVNHRYLDCTVKAPRQFGFLDDAVKKAAAARIARGKTEIYVSVETDEGGDLSVTVNHALAERYLAALRELSEKYGLRDDVTVMSLAKLPDVLGSERIEQDADELTQDVLTVFAEACDGFDQMREREGEKLADLHQLDGMLNEVKPVGRKLDFLVQEMNREANTIGSKANDVEMAQTVVNIKSEIEKIREQIQNIE